MRTIAVDSMGGDNAPAAEVHGAIAAVRDSRESDLAVVLVGDEQRLGEELTRAAAGRETLERIHIRHASQVVTMADSPAQALRRKPDSSLRVAFGLVQAGEADAVVSAGNTGAVLGHALLLLGRMPGVTRPGILAVFPTPSGELVLCDMGANVEVKPTMLAQFGILAANYDRIVHGRERPRVGLLSNGVEPSKGTELTRAAHALLESAAANPAAKFDYLGYVEGSEIFRGAIDVVATDGFTGNVVLKTSEGLSAAILEMIRDDLERHDCTCEGEPAARTGLARLSRAVDSRETGGALLGGVNGAVLVCHGGSDAVAIRNAVVAASDLVARDVIERLARAIDRHRDVLKPAAHSGQGQGSSGPK